MDDSSVTATSKIDSSKSVSGEISSQTIEHVMNSEINVGQTALPDVNGEIDVVDEEKSHTSNLTSSGVPLSKALVSDESTPSSNLTQSPSDVTTCTLTSVTSPMDTTVEKSLLTASIKSNSEASTLDVQGSTSAPSINDTSTAKVTASLQSDRTDMDGSVMAEKMLLSSSETHTVTATIAATISSVTHSASATTSSIAGVNVATHNVPKLEPSTMSKIKINPRDFDNFTFQKPALPVIGASGYNSNKVAAEMAKIDSFLASLAKGNPTPSVKVKTETAGVAKPAPVGSALGNIALSYGYSEEESSSSSSGDESEDDRPFNVKSADAAVIAMDTQEVEQSMKKVAVSSDSSSSSEDEQGDVDVKRPHFTPRTKSEILLQDLPPVQPIDFVLSEDSTLEQIGSVHSIVEQIVVVAHKSKFQVVNIDTIFWLDDRSPLGKVFEVFGPVVSPYYSVRINQNEKMRVNGVGSAAYFVSNDSTLTFYFFSDCMENQKGSDASWLNDEEPPTQFLEYSDDEEEAMVKRGFRKHRSPPKSGQRKPKQLHKERYGRHLGISNTTSFTQSRNLTSHSNPVSLLNGQSIYSSNIQPLHCSSSFQEYHTAPVHSVHPSTIQNNIGNTFPLPVLDVMPSPLQYSPVHPPQAPIRPPLLPYPPGIPFHYASQNCFPSSSGATLPPTVHLHPPATLPEM